MVGNIGDAAATVVCGQNCGRPLADPINYCCISFMVTALTIVYLNTSARSVAAVKHLVSSMLTAWLKLAR